MTQPIDIITRAMKAICAAVHTPELLLLTKRLKMLLQLLKSRTVLFALFLAVLSILQGYVNLLPLSPTDQMYVGIAISVVVTLLRIVTTQPISEK